MKLEVGMYVRTPLGICKYLGKAEYENFITGEIVKTDMEEFDKLDDELWSDDVANWVFDSDIKDVVLKFSYNIIDLIELGDLIKVECEKDNTNVFEVIAIDVKNKELGVFNNNFEIDWVGIEQVKSIVAKEQFENIEYEI